MNSHNNDLINKFHNRVNNNNTNSKKIECNCKSRTDCPMNGLCNLGNVVYQPIINPKEDNQFEIYNYILFFYYQYYYYVPGYEIN